METMRRAESADIDELLRLEIDFPSDRLTRRNLRHLLRSRSADVWVCQGSTGLMGDVVLLFRAHAATARVYSLVVDPLHRGRGIGARLLETAEQVARARGSLRLRLEVRPDNRKARGLYERAGFAMTACAPGFYQDGSDALVYIKELALAPAAIYSARTQGASERLSA